LKKQNGGYLTGWIPLIFLVVAITTTLINYAIIFSQMDKVQQWAFISIETGILFGVVGNLAELWKRKG